MMAYARPFGQAQGASPWSSGAPPGLQQQQQQQNQQQPQMQPMFNQPMGAFDISAGWNGQQQAQPQWVAQVPQVQFVPNPAFVPQQPQMRQPQMQQQRPMHQRSLSAPRNGVQGVNRQNNQYNNFGGRQQQGGNWQRGQQNNNNQFQNRVARQQSRMNNPKGQSNNNNNNSNHKNFNNNNNSSNRSSHQGQQQQQQQQQKEKQNQQSNNQTQKRGTAKVTKVKKQLAVKAKQAPKQRTAKVTTSTEGKAKHASNGDGQPKAQSKTAERKQIKLQARKAAEGLKKSQMPAIKGTKFATGDDHKDEPIDQAQMKCVPAVFGYVCKLCEVFLREKIARREHIESDGHMEKFRAFEENEKKKLDEQKPKAEADGDTKINHVDEAETSCAATDTELVVRVEPSSDEADTQELESAEPDKSSEVDDS